jgi:RNA polymerase sigma-70 factor, ECF subfamily
MRRMRICGNELRAIPVILYVTPLPIAGTFGKPHRRLGRNAVVSHPRTLKSGADLTMKDRIGGNQRRARFQALCQSLRPDLLRFAFWLARDRALAEDVVQESMLRAWKAQDSLLDERAAKPWFLTIIRREFARTFERKRLPLVDLDELIMAEEPGLAAADQNDLAELRAAIFKLPHEYREPLVLQVLMGYSTAEIARELNLSEPAVLTRLFRARNQLRTLCGEDTSQDPQE